VSMSALIALRRARPDPRQREARERQARVCWQNTGKVERAIRQLLDPAWVIRYALGEFDGPTD
jgi:hypothetical protein